MGAISVDRTGFIGGSDIAAILGLSRWKTPLQVWAEKTGNVVPEDISAKLQVRLGNKLEATVCDLFTEETGKKVARVNEPLVHSKYPFLRGQIDRRVVGERAILEAKTTTPWNADKWKGEDNIPQDYILQTLFYMELAKAERGYLCCLIGNQDFQIKVIERDEKLQKEIISKAVDFWTKYIEPKEMPTMITSRDAETLYSLYPIGDEEAQPIILDDTANALVDTLMAHQEDSKALANQIDKTKNELRLMLKDSAVGITDKWTISWKNQETNRVDLKKLKEAEPAICEKFLDKTSSRVLRVKAIKGEKK
jgi:putative phage-type endonuclease